MTEEESKAEIQRMRDTGTPREQIEEFVRNAKEGLVAKTDEPKEQKFEYIDNQNSTKSAPAPVIEKNEPKFSFNFMEKDTDSGVKLDENFFNLKDEKAVEKLNASIYGNSYNFE